MCDFIYRDEGGAEFYTGHSQQERKMLWDLLGPSKNMLEVWGKPEGFLNNQIRDLSIECQFLITLMILRRNKTYTECGHQFDVCPTIVSMVFKTWLAFFRATFKTFEDYIIGKENKFKKKPKAFRNKLLKNTEYDISPNLLLFKDNLFKQSLQATQAVKIQFVELDFYNLTLKKSYR